MEQIRKLPIGIQTFDKLREGGFLYVDKTAMIYQIASTSTPYFLSRPPSVWQESAHFHFRSLLSRTQRLVSGLGHRTVGNEVGTVSCSTS